MLLPVWKPFLLLSSLISPVLVHSVVEEWERALVEVVGALRGKQRGQVIL